MESNMHKLNEWGFYYLLGKVEIIENEIFYSQERSQKKYFSHISVLPLIKPALNSMDYKKVYQKLKRKVITSDTRKY